MMTHPLLPKLKTLKLSGMLETLEARARAARDDAQSPVEFLALLLDDEIERREQTRSSRRVREAGIESNKTLARFDFAASPHAPKTLLADLALCRFLERGENVLFVGPTGTGKSHLAQALAWEAIQRDRRVLYKPVHTMLAHLHAARADGTYHRQRAKLTNVDVLVLDDFGLVPLPAHAIEDLYELIRERYERRSIILTSNRAPEEWGEVFGNPLLASAALDRLTHHAHLITLTGSSYRQRERKRNRKGETDSEPESTATGKEKRTATDPTPEKPMKANPET
jgi:DNA replication protein DnaC